MPYTSDFGNIDFDLGLETLEKVVMRSERKQQVNIGIPKETVGEERRVAIAPSGVKILAENGHTIYVEKGAGNLAGFSDREYSEAGGNVTPSAEDLYKKSNVIVKVAPPSEFEYDLLQENQILISALNLGSMKRELLDVLLRKNIISLAFEFIETKDGEHPVVRTLSEIAGAVAVQIAAKYLESGAGGRGILMGGVAGVPPATVSILGAGTVGQYAAKAALGLGASVLIIDKNLNRLRRIENIFDRRVATAIANDHYIARAVRISDVLIGAANLSSKRTKYLVSEEMVMRMRNGSVIIDVAIDQGGCIETSRPTTHANPVFMKHGVTHYCVPNIPSAVARTSSYALTNAVLPFVLKIGDYGTINDALWKSHSLRTGTYTYKGYTTKKILSEMFSISYREVQLLLATDI
jgi:alanine dehydrogenase